MSTPADNAVDRMRSLGTQGLIDEAERAGLTRSGLRIECPDKGCQTDHGSKSRSVGIFQGADGKGLWWCHRGSHGGDLADMLQLTQGLSNAEALHVIAGTTPSTPRPTLRVVSPLRPAVVEDFKLETGDVEKIWAKLEKPPITIAAYLEGRNLGGAIDADMVRAIPADITTALVLKPLANSLREGLTLFVPLFDVFGRLRGGQVKLPGKKTTKDQVTVKALSGSKPGRSFLGNPGAFATTSTVCITEGIADTLAMRLWAGEGSCVIGAAGQGNLKSIPRELELAYPGLSASRTFVLFPQNDGGGSKSNGSAQAFAALRATLCETGANVISVHTPSDYADVADWRQGEPGIEWPPAEFQQQMVALGETDVEKGTGENPYMLMPSGISFTERVHSLREGRVANDQRTLMHILGSNSEASRRFLVAGEQWRFNTMTTEPCRGTTPVAEEDIMAFRLGIEDTVSSANNKPLKYTKQEIAEAVLMLAKKNPFSPVRDYINALPAWDGKANIETVTATLGEVTPLKVAMVRKWMLAAVNRVLEPGCKADSMLVLVGGEGKRKSTFFNVLAGEFFSDQQVDIRNKDSWMGMRSAWIVEWAEMDAMRSGNNEALKGFITRKEDVFRPPYAMKSEAFARHFIFCGTTNNEQFLSDPTGSRRFYPIGIPHDHVIDTDAVAVLREQAWAEALHALEVGHETTYLDRAVELERQVETERYQEGDVWTEDVMLAARQLSLVPGRRGAFSTAEVLKQMGLDLTRATRVESCRAANILRSAGYVLHVLYRDPGDGRKRNVKMWLLRQAPGNSQED